MDGKRQSLGRARSVSIALAATLGLVGSTLAIGRLDAATQPDLPGVTVTSHAAAPSGDVSRAAAPATPIASPAELLLSIGVPLSASTRDVPGPHVAASQVSATGVLPAMGVTEAGLWVDAIRRPTDGSAEHDVKLSFLLFDEGVPSITIFGNGEDVTADGFFGDNGFGGVTFTHPGQLPGEVLEYKVEVRFDLGGGSFSFDDLGPLTVVIPDPSKNCTIAWTGAAADKWVNEQNWARIVDIGDPVPDPSAPNLTDHACIDVNNNLPVLVDTSGNAADIVSSSLPAGTPTVSVLSGGSLAVGGALTVGAVEVRGGALEVKGAATFGTDPTDDATLTLDGGTLELAASSTSSGTFVVTDDSTLAASVGGTTLSLGSVGLIESNGSTLTGQGGIVVSANDLKVANADLVTGPGGATLDTLSFDVLAGESQVNWGLDSVLGIDVLPGGDATVTDLVGLRDNSAYPGTFDVHDGKLTVTQPITSVGDSDTFLRLNNGLLTINGKPANDLTDLELLKNLELLSSDIKLADGLTFDFIELFNSLLDVDGKLTFERELGLDEGSRIEAALVQTEGARSFEGNIDVYGDAEIVGDVAISGDIRLDNSREFGWADPHRLLIDGDFTMGPSSEVRVIADPTGSSTLEITGTLNADGTLRVTLPELLDGRVDEQLIDAGNVNGDFDDVEVNAIEPGGTDVEVEKDEGEYLLRGGEVTPPAECTEVPDVAGMPVRGCWVPTGQPEEFRTDQDLGVDPFTIGAVEFVVDTNEQVVLNLDAGTLTSTRVGEREVVAIEMSIPVVREDAGGAITEVARIDFGETVLDRWEYESLLTVPLVDLLGLPVQGNVTFAVDDGHWNINVPTQLPEFLDLDTLFEFDVEPVGLRDEQLGLDELEAVVGELFGLSDVELDWVSDRIWSISSDDAAAANGFAGRGFRAAPRAPLDGSTIGIDGTIDFDPVGTGGIINVRGMVIADLVKIPDFSIGFVRSTTIDQWLFTGGEQSAIRRIKYTYARTGGLQSAEIFLGDEADRSVRDSVANWGEWLDIDALNITTSDAESWAMAGRLTQPDIDFTGTLRTEKGDVIAASLDIDGAELGAVARFDMSLELDTSTNQYLIAATLVGDGFADRSGGGFIDLDGGEIEAARLEFNELPLGELATLDNVALNWDGNANYFGFAAEVDRATGPPVAVDGQFKFNKGQVAIAHLEIDEISFGFVTIDDFEIDFRAVLGDDRSTSFDLTGRVRGPVVEEMATDDPVVGSMQWEDGKLLAFDLDLPRIDIGLAHLNDVQLSYGTDEVAGTATLAGTAELETSDSTTSVDADFEFTLRDGDLVAGQVAADEITFGEIVSINDFMLSYNAAAPAPRCAALGATTADALWAVSGETRTLDARTEVEGCLGYNDGVVVAGALDVGDLRVGPLFTITSITLSVQGVTTENVEFSFGARDVTTTTFDLEASWTGPNGNATAIDGSMVITNGGLSEFDVTIPLLRLTYLVRLENLVFSYDAGKVWDGDADTSVTLSGTLLNGPDVSTFAGSATFGDGRSLDALSIDVTDVDFGLFLLDELSFVYDGTGDDSRWEFDGEFTTVDGTSEVSGDLVVDGGEMQSGSLVVEQLGIAGVIDINDLELGYDRTDDSETWSGTADVAIGDGNATAAVSVRLNDAGLLTAGSLVVEVLNWGDLFRIENFELRYAGDRWDIRGTYVPTEGPTSELEGFMLLDDGQVIGGKMVVTGVKLGSLATIDQLELAAVVEGPITGWAATIDLADGTTGTGRMVWEDGVLTEANLNLGQIRAGDLFTIDDLTISYTSEKASIWALSGTVTASGETTSVGGDLTFVQGKIVGGGLELTNFRFGPLDLEQLTLVAGTAVDVDNASVDVSTICGVADTGVGGVRWGMTATMRIGGGGLTSLGGRLRLNDGAITEGVFCADEVAVTELARLDDLLLAYTDDGTTETWAGSATVRNPEEPSTPFTAEAMFAFADGSLTTATVDVTGLRLGNMLTLTDVLFSYVDDGDLVTWQVGATVARPGPDASMSGSLDVDGGRIVGGSLTITELSFGNAFTLDNLEIDYVGRRALTDNPAENASPLEFGSSIGNGCNSTPSGGNVPSGTPTTAGAESYFRVDATVTSGGSTFSAAGSAAFSDGDLSAFDISVACVPIGEWFTIEDFRVAYTDEGSFLIAARLGNGDDADDVPGPSVRGLANFDDGRLVGGQLAIADVSLGATKLETFDLTLGQQPDGTSEWALTVGVRNSDNELRTGSGSLTIDDGRLVAGSLTIPEISIADIIEVRNLDLGFDSTETNKLRVWGSAEVGRDGNPASLDVDVKFEDGRVIEGSFSADRVKLFQMIPVSSFSIGYVDNTWTGSFGAEPETGSVGPSIEAAFEIRNGRLVSGLIGFDGNGDGEPDSPNSSNNAPASGSGQFAAFPLRAFYLRYCAAGSVASFCDDVSGSAWDGRVRIEIPSESAPAVEAELRVRDGRFAAASILVENASIPVFLGLFINEIDASLELDPRLRMCGGLGLSAGGPSLMLIQINAQLSYGEEFSDYPMPTPDGCRLTNPPAIPDDVRPDYHRFLVQGQGDLFPGNPLDIGLEASGFADIQTRGYLGVGAGIDVELLSGFAGVNGFVEGSVFNANNIDIEHPLTGDQLTGTFVQVRGGVGGELLGRDLPLGIDFVANTIGFTVCAEVGIGTIGVAKYWSGGRTRFSCKLAEFEVIVPGTATSASSSPFGAALTLGTTPDSEFFVQPGEELLGVDVWSAEGQPDAILIAPGGQRYRADDADDSDGSMVATGENQRMFVIKNPPAGRWQVIAASDSPRLSKITTYRALPDAEVDGSVTNTGGTFTLNFDVTDLPGQHVAFVEREVGDQIIAGIGSVSSEGSTVIGKGLSVAESNAAGDQIGQSRSLESTGNTSGRFEFRPSGRPGGGQREIVALVSQDGLPRTELVVATYTAPDATEAGAPGSVTATATSQGADVTWAPVTDDGGRSVLSYRISSTRGFAAAAASDATSASLEIPFMTPGETVIVYVEALTSSGWGVAGTATFVATATTGAQFDTDYNLAAGVELPGSNPIITDEFVPEPPPTTEPPTTPPTTQPPTTQPPTTQPPTAQPPASPGGDLPATGSSASPLGLTAAVVALLGLILLGVARRRRTFTGSH